VAMNIAVIGLGRFGSHIAETLARAGVDVTAVDLDRDCIERLRDHVSTAIAFDATDENELRFHGMEKIEVAVVAIGDDFEANLLTTVNLKSLGVPRVVSRVASRLQGRILKKVGADVIVNPEDEAAERWANRLLTPHIIDHIELARNYALIQMAVPPAWRDKTLASLDIRQKFNVNIVAIKRQRRVETTDGGETTIETIVDVPLPSSQLTSEDILIIAGKEADLDKLPH